MTDLINRCYTATRKRGKITPDTDFPDFIEKMEEELQEIKQAYESGDFEHAIHETGDLFATCSNALTHHGYDVEKEFEKVVIKNEGRRD
jgi:NTP pyrophosphatase (non-canonical NTP hydrolase)